MAEGVNNVNTVMSLSHYSLVQSFFTVFVGGARWVGGYYTLLINVIFNKIFLMFQQQNINISKGRMCIYSVETCFMHISEYGYNVLLNIHSATLTVINRFLFIIVLI